MFETLLVTLREGLEAFLIVAVTFSYLEKTGRKNLYKPVYYGIGASILASIMLAFLISKYMNQELAEGVLGIVAGVLVLTLTVHMLKAGKKMSQEIRNNLEKNAAKEGKAAAIGVFVFILLMVTREGFEITLLFQSIAVTSGFSEMLFGAIFGILASIFVGLAWIKYSHLINIGRFLQVTAVFLILFAIHLILLGVHELTESFALPFSHEVNTMLHENTEFLDSDQIFGQIISYSIIVVPLLWLAVASYKDWDSKMQKA